MCIRDRGDSVVDLGAAPGGWLQVAAKLSGGRVVGVDLEGIGLLYTSDAADDLRRVDLGGRRIIKKKKKR